MVLGDISNHLKDLEIVLIYDRQTTLYWVHYMYMCKWGPHLYSKYLVCIKRRAWMLHYKGICNKLTLISSFVIVHWFYSTQRMDEKSKRKIWLEPPTHRGRFSTFLFKSAILKTSWYQKFKNFRFLEKTGGFRHARGQVDPPET